MLGIGLGVWQLGGNRNLVSASGVAAGLYLDTKANSAFVSGMPSDLASILNVVRATTASDEYADGSIVSVGTNVARYGGGQGLLIERGATNTIRNSTNVGAAAGTPGTIPSNWGVFAAGGLAINVAGFGTLGGVPYTDLRLVGTSSSTFYVLSFEGATAIAATAGEVWTASAYTAVVGGSLANISAVSLASVRFIGGAANVATNNGIPGASLARNSVSATAGVGVTNVVATTGILMTSGAAIDITLRIGGVQLETGPKATSFIPTSTVAVTRNADQVKVTGAPLTAGIGAGTAFTIFAEYEAYVSADASYIWGVGNDATPSINESIYATVSTSRTGAASVVSASSNTFTNAAAALNTPATINRMAMRVAANDAAISHNGAAIITDGTITMPASLDRLTLGSSPGSIGNQAINGRITRFAAWPSLLSNADLVALNT